MMEASAALMPFNSTRSNSELARYSSLTRPSVLSIPQGPIQSLATKLRIPEPLTPPFRKVLTPLFRSIDPPGVENIPVY